jgi:N-acetylglucosamine-6-phosphate deacetylase
MHAIETTTTETIARHYRTGQPWRVSFRDGAVERVEPCDEPVLGSLILAPTLFDIQVNGFAGVDFNAWTLQDEDVRQATRALARYGVTRFLPTVVTGPPDRMRTIVQVIVEARQRYPEVDRAVSGVHVEGPYISGLEGSRGAHDPRWVRPPDEAEFSALQEVAAGLISLVTLAPEVDGALAFIRRRVAEGIVVAIGHTSAGEKEIRAAVEAGARLSTHLGNGCAGMLPRHENPITVQLGQDELMASFIADGHHLPPYLLKSFVRAKEVRRSILTTDCMSAAGAEPGKYRLADLELEVGEDRVVRQPGQSNLAGSALTLDHAVANTAQWCGVSLADAIDMASLHPARLFYQQASFNPTASGDFILAAASPAFAIDTTVRAGTRLS